MRIRCLSAVLIWLAGVICTQAQFGSFGDIPVEITADGNTRFEGGVAIAEDNVQIHYGDYSIYCDYAEYNPDTRDVLLVGNIRLYTPDQVMTGQRALFNLETKQMRALEFSGAHYPLFFRAFSLRAPSTREFRVKDAIFTADDSSQPDFFVKSKSVRIYPDSRVIFSNSTVYVGQTPIFWFPYIFANINNTGIEFLPGYDSRWGAYLMTAYSFPIGPGGNIIGKVRGDYRTELGVAFGFDAIFRYGKDDRSFGEFVSYYADDQQPDRDVGGPGEPNEPGEQGRYRVTFKHRLFLTDDIYVTADINLLSDVDFLEDFYPNEFRIDPQPDTYLSVTKWDEFYTLSLLGRWQINEFQDTTERLPELVLDIKQHRIFGLPFYYDGETSVGQYRRAFSDTPEFGEEDYPDYSATRFDTFHQLSFPNQFFGWLNVIPRMGFRATYYSDSGTFQDFGGVTEYDPVTGELQTVTGPSIESTPLNSPTPILQNKGAVFRPVVNFGVEVSTKVSKAYERIQSRMLGLDGVRHVMQPYANYSLVYNLGASPQDILQFDRVVPSTQLLPLDFPQFTAVDTIDTWNIVRLGVRNRIQTRRDQTTFQWMSLDTFFDVNFDNPYSDASVSNIFNIYRFRPVQWFFLDVESQLPITSQGFTEFNTGFNFMPTKDFSFRIGHRYIDGNEFFADNSQFDFFAYFRINENWGFSLYEQYEYVSNILQYQRYMIHRDLSSWVASFGAQFRDNQGGDSDMGVLFVLTLKNAPQVTLPGQFDQGTSPIEPGANGN
ncbi:MAG TPA: LPS assembly protein LptD [Terrimicrobiaceae bacterium]|nr:LPS assembly protein LptD [Terrimicrobiaceae bacterium]